MSLWVEITDEDDIETIKTLEFMIQYGKAVDMDVEYKHFINQGQKRR